MTAHVNRMVSFFKLRRWPFDLRCPAVPVCVWHVCSNLVLTNLEKKVSASCLHLSLLLSINTLNATETPLGKLTRTIPLWEPQISHNLQIIIKTGAVKSPDILTFFPFTSYATGSPTFSSATQNPKSHWPCDPNGTYTHTYNDWSKITLVRGWSVYHFILLYSYILCSFNILLLLLLLLRRSQWPSGPGRGSAIARFLGLWVRIPTGAWMSVSCECCVLWGTGLCDGLITRPEESHWVWCVWVWSRNLKHEVA
jgi:hypothetical protein